MSEQQRIMLAVFLCVVIFVGWQFMLPPPAQPPAKRPVATAPVAGEANQAARESSDASRGDEELTGEEGAVPERAAPSVRELSSPLLRAKVQDAPFVFRSLDLEKYQQTESEEIKGAPRVPVSLVGAKDGQAYQAGFYWTEDAEGEMRFVDDERPNAVRAEDARANGLSTQVTLSARKDEYVFEYDLRVTNETQRAQRAGAYIELVMDVPERGGMFDGPGDMSMPLCEVNDSVERMDLDDLLEEAFQPAGTSRWAGVDRQYFVVAAMSELPAKCSMSARGRTVFVRYELQPVSVAPNSSWEGKLTLFAGPKLNDLLAATKPGLENIIDYDAWGIPLGFIARPMVFLLNVFHDWVGSWGVAIILLTLTVKLVLFPVTYKSAVGMRQMQLLKPELDKLKERFPDDRERQQMEQLKLFKERGVNPLQGCLPMLLQMPVWLALYRSLWSAVDLYQQPFLWLPDLTAKEPGIPFLALGLGVVFFAQQLLTPMTTDNQQAKVMRWVMPIMFTFFMFALPSGLVLYIFVNTVLSVGQQLVINKSVGPAPAVVAAKTGGKSEKRTGDHSSADKIHPGRQHKKLKASK